MKNWYMLVCPECSTDNWFTDKHCAFLANNPPASALCRRCDKKLKFMVEFIGDELGKNTIIADPPPGISALAPKFETWLIKLMRVRDKCPEVSEVVEEMKACMKTREPEEGEYEKGVGC